MNLGQTDFPKDIIVAMVSVDELEVGTLKLLNDNVLSEILWQLGGLMSIYILQSSDVIKSR